MSCAINVMLAVGHNAGRDATSGFQVPKQLAAGPGAESKQNKHGGSKSTRIMARDEGDVTQNQVHLHLMATE